MRFLDKKRLLYLTYLFEERNVIRTINGRFSIHKDIISIINNNQKIDIFLSSTLSQGPSCLEAGKRYPWDKLPLPSG